MITQLGHDRLNSQRFQYATAKREEARAASDEGARIPVRLFETQNDPPGDAPLKRKL